MKIRSESQLQQVRKQVSFCYLCGAALKGIPTNTDHVPPRSLFARSDRQRPLTLVTHVTCHERASAWDQITGDLVSLGHDPDRERQQLPKQIVVVSQERELLGVQVPLQHVLIRYLQAFHAALYSEYLPFTEATFSVELPFTEYARSNVGWQLVPTQPASSAIVEVLKKNRVAGTIDSIECFGDKCRYMCVWSKLDSGEPCCLFGLQLYDWERLSDPRFPQRAACGLYRTNSMPHNATYETSLAIPFTNVFPLDPFKN